MPKKTKKQKQQAVQRRIIPPNTITVEQQSSPEIHNPSLQYSLPSKTKRSVSSISAVATQEDHVLFAEMRKDIFVTMGLAVTAISALFALSRIIG